MFSLRNRPEKLAEGSLFCLFLKLVQINFIFTDNVRILYIYLALEPDIFTLQVNIPTTVLLTVNDKLVLSINTFLYSDVKNKLCFILCQDKTFEDKMNCQFQRVLSVSQYSLQMFIFQLVEACHQYNKHKTDIIKINWGKIMCRHVPKVPYGSYATVHVRHSYCYCKILIQLFVVNIDI